MSDVRNVIIIGGGPAGYTAALYTARANLEPLVIEGFNWGGQLMITSDVENYPGYPDGVIGPTMMQEFREQAERFGTEFVTDDVTRVDFSERPFRVWIGDEEHRAETVIVATGASARQLGLENEVRLQGRGVSYCATCDASFFRDQRRRRRRRRRLRHGGGDLHLAVRVQGLPRPPPRRVPRLADHARSRAREREASSSSSTRPSRTSSATTKVTGVALRDTVDGALSELATDGIFVAIGHDPNTALFLGQLDHEPRPATS